MSRDILIERLFEALVTGDRPASRDLVEEALGGGAAPQAVASELFWPVYERITAMHRADQLSLVAHNLATKLLRTLVDQVALRYQAAPSTGRSVFALCGPTDADELGAQIAVDLMEAAGHEVAFAGGGIANDEVLAQVQQRRPDVLLIFASAPSDLPEIRALIDTISEIGACSNTQVVVGGGVFNRAEGLAEEIGADLWAETPAELVEVVNDFPERRATEDQRTVGRNKRRRVA